MPGPRGWLPGTAIALSIAANAFLIYAVDHTLSREPLPATILDDDPDDPDDDLDGVRLVRPDGLTLRGIELVALPAPPTPSTPAAAAPIGRARAVAGRAGIGTGTGTGVVEAPGVEAPGGGGGLGVLGMRGRRHDLSLSREAMAHILGTGYELPAPVEPTGRIRGGKIDDAVATVRVHPDGTVDLKGKPHIEIHIGPPIPTMQDVRAFGRNIATWYEDPYKRYREVGRTQDLPRHITAVPGACTTWGEPGCESTTTDGSAPYGRVEQATRTGFMPLIWGKLDLTGWLMEKTVGDAYASRKLKLLDSTREERIAAGTAYRAQRQARSAEYIGVNLEALWRTTTDAAARRTALFTLWDECTEDEAGQRARSMVIGWIRARLPVGSPGAFSAEDIAALDARRGSTQHFAPY